MTSETKTPLTTAPEDGEYEDTLTWEDSYAIAQALRARYPQAQLDEISITTIYNWTIALPGFADDPQIANDGILEAIIQEWFEEENPL